MGVLKEIYARTQFASEAEYGELQQTLSQAIPADSSKKSP
jgi:hypothetical protein